MNLLASPIAVASVSFLLAAVTTMVLVPQVRRLGLRFGWADQPDERKQHITPMVRLGALPWCWVLPWLWRRSGPWGLRPAGAGQGSADLEHPGRFALLFSDWPGGRPLRPLSPWPRLAGQVAVACAVWSQGVRIGAIDLPWFTASAGPIALPDSLSLLATVVWLVGITNAINWLDGLDGLAAGVAGIAAVGLVSVSFSLHQVAAGFLAAALAGCCLGFLRHNFNPARIFMGDGGSYFLGFTLAAVSIVGPAKGLTTVSLLLPLLILSLPLADMSAVIMGRLREGRSPFYPDRRHLHHRLLRAGFSHRRTVLLIYVFTQWLAALALVVANAEMRFLWLALATAILVATVVISRRQLQHERALLNTNPCSTPVDPAALGEPRG